MKQTPIVFPLLQYQNVNRKWRFLHRHQMGIVLMMMTYSQSGNDDLLHHLHHLDSHLPLVSVCVSKFSSVSCNNCDEKQTPHPTNKEKLRFLCFILVSFIRKGDYVFLILFELFFPVSIFFELIFPFHSKIS